MSAHRRPPIACGMCAIAATSVLLTAQQPQLQQPTFRSAIDLVRLDVSVMRAGQPVRGLTARDFAVSDNGIRQRINSVSLVEELPISVVMVLDTSGSLFGPRLESLVDAGKGVLAALRPDDRAALVTFSQDVQLRVPLTLDRTRITRELAALAAAGSTSIRDAVWTALQLRANDEARPLVLVFSDGVDNTSWLSVSDILTAAERSDTVIHAVGLPEAVIVSSSAGTTRATMPSSFLQELAEAAGGRHWSARSERELRELFTRALDEMRARYLVTFYPQDVTRDGWHDLKVTVKTRGEVTTRPGYFVPSRN